MAGGWCHPHDNLYGMWVHSNVVPLPVFWIELASLVSIYGRKNRTVMFPVAMSPEGTKKSWALL